MQVRFEMTQLKQDQHPLAHLKDIWSRHERVTDSWTDRTTDRRMNRRTDEGVSIISHAFSGGGIKIGKNECYCCFQLAY